MITKPPIFKSTRQLCQFFEQEDIAGLRPLGKIVGFVVKELAPRPPKDDDEKKDDKDKVDFHALVGVEREVSTWSRVIASMPIYNLPTHFMRSLVHTGIMRRVRWNKDKSDYRQVVTPCPDYVAELAKLQELEKQHKLDDKDGKHRLK